MRNSNLALKEQNKGILAQNFQNTFFNWLSTYRQNLELAKFLQPHRNIERTGASALNHLYRTAFARHRIHGQLLADQIGEHYDSIISFRTIESAQDIEQVHESLKRIWIHFREEEDHVLGPILRSLSGLAKWLFTRSPNAEMRAEYLTILSSQLTTAELTLLYFNLIDKDIDFAHQLQEHHFFEFSEIDDPVLYFLLTSVMRK